MSVQWTAAEAWEQYEQWVRVLPPSDPRRLAALYRYVDALEEISRTTEQYSRSDGEQHQA